MKAIYHTPLLSSPVKAGFPSPADEYIEMYLDLNSHLIKHPSATFFLTAAGDSMINAGIHPGDLLIVDRSLTAQHGKIVIAAVDGDLTVKRLYQKGNRVRLISANTLYPPIEITNAENLVIWGVVIYVIHQAR